MTSSTIDATGDHQYTPEALQVCIDRLRDCVDTAVSAEQAAQEIGRPVSMVRDAIRHGIKTGELAFRNDGLIEFARTVPSDKPAGMTRAEKRKRRAWPVFRGSIGAAYALLCEHPGRGIDELSDHLDCARLQTLKLLGRLKQQGLATNAGGEWRPVAVLQPHQLDAIRKTFPAHRTMLTWIHAAKYITHRELNQSQRGTAKLLVRRGLLATTERRGLLAYELTPLCVECLPVIKAHGDPMTSAEDIAARLAPWRELYETDPTVSQASIAASVGLCVRTVNVYARRLGWRACAKRRGTPGTRSAPVAATPAGSAAPSIWALAQGIGVSTARHGGKHVEVRA